MKIGFFDSGIGGCTIMQAVRGLMPQYGYMYYGDTAHVPYGDKSEEEIFALTREGITHLFARDCAIVILACNTASAETLRRLQDTFLPEAYPDRRLLGVIIPTIEEIVTHGAHHTLLIATVRTVRSLKYEKELASRNVVHTTFSSEALPELVPLIEANRIEEAARLVIDVVDARQLTGEAIDTLILGCTHYTVLKDLLRMRYEEALRIVSQDEVIPRKLASYLLAHPELEMKLTRSETVEKYFTGSVDAAVLARLELQSGEGR